MSRLVEADDLVISYATASGQVRALDGARLVIEEGETLAIVGESGSGKSTLGMAIGKLLPAEAACEGGTLVVAGRSVLMAGPEELRALRRDQLGFVFQNPMTALDPTMRIGNQVARAIGGRVRPAAIAALLERAELDDPKRVMRSFPHELSGGMAQRVVIAMAIARSPKLIIADEPTASLDASIRDRVMQTLRRLRDETGASLVILSHDLRMVARHADRVAVMYGGRIVEVGNSDSVFRRPAHPYTRALIAAGPGNERPGERLTPIVGTPPVLPGRLEKCPFEPRCTERASICAQERPEERSVEDRRVVCHFAERVIAVADKAEKVAAR
jgi:peptide/nickel transport system ATP-binding protein